MRNGHTNCSLSLIQQRAQRYFSLSFTWWTILLLILIPTFYFAVYSPWMVVDDWVDVPGGMQRLKVIVDDPFTHLLEHGKLRYRPLFHPINSGLPWLLSKSPVVHHLFRILWLVNGLWFARRLLYAISGNGVMALVVTIAMLCDREIVINTFRLGPQEGILAPILMAKLFTVWALTAALQEGKTRKASWVAILSALLTFLLLGLKEISLAICIPLIAYEVYILSRYCRQSKYWLIYLSFVVEIFFFIYTGIQIVSLILAKSYVTYATTQTAFSWAVLRNVTLQYFHELFPWPLALVIAVGIWGLVQWFKDRNEPVERKYFVLMLCAVIAAAFAFGVGFRFFMPRYILPAKWVLYVLAGWMFLLSYRKLPSVRLKGAVCGIGTIVLIAFLLQIPANVKWVFNSYLSAKCNEVGTQLLFGLLEDTTNTAYIATPYIEKVDATRAFSGTFWRPPINDVRFANNDSTKASPIADRILPVVSSSDGTIRILRTGFLVVDCDGKGLEWTRQFMRKNNVDTDSCSLQIEYAVTPDYLYRFGDSSTRINLAMWERITAQQLPNDARYLIYACRPHLQ